MQDKIIQPDSPIFFFFERESQLKFKIQFWVNGSPFWRESHLPKEEEKFFKQFSFKENWIIVAPIFPALRHLQIVLYHPPFITKLLPPFNVIRYGQSLNGIGLHSAYFKGLTISVWLVRLDRVIYVYFFMLILKIKFLKNFITQ